MNYFVTDKTKLCSVVKSAPLFGIIAIVDGEIKLQIDCSGVRNGGIDKFMKNGCQT